MKTQHILVTVLVLSLCQWSVLSEDSQVSTDQKGKFSHSHQMKFHHIFDFVCCVNCVCVFVLVYWAITQRGNTKLFDSHVIIRNTLICKSNSAQNQSIKKIYASLDGVRHEMNGIFVEDRKEERKKTWLHQIFINTVKSGAREYTLFLLICRHSLGHCFMTNGR